LEQIELNDSVFGIEPNESVMTDAVLMQERRYVKVLTKLKGRSEVRGGDVNRGNRKELDVLVKVQSVHHNGWRWFVFVPHQEHGYKLPKKVRRLAIKSVLSAKSTRRELIILDQFTLAAPKTKSLFK